MPQGWAVPAEVQPAPCARRCQQLPRQGWDKDPAPGQGVAVGRGVRGGGARGFHNPGLAVYLSTGAGPGGGCLFAESVGSRPGGGGKGSRGTRLGRPARHWGGAGTGMALPAPPAPNWEHPLETGPPPSSQPAPAAPALPPPIEPHWSTHRETQGWAPSNGWGGGHILPKHKVLQHVWDSHGHSAGHEVSIIRLDQGLGTGEGTDLAQGPHTALQGPCSGGLPIAGECPWPSKPGRGPCTALTGGSKGDGGAGRTVYVWQCQVLARHRASRNGAQLLNTLPPHAASLGPSEAGTRHPKPARRLQTPSFPMPHRGRKVWSWDKPPWTPVPAQTPAHGCSPNKGSWASGIRAPGIPNGGPTPGVPRSAAWGREPRSPSRGAHTRPSRRLFLQSPAGAGQAPELPGIQRLVPAPRKTLLQGPGQIPATRNLPPRPGVAPGSRRTHGPERSQGWQQRSWG